MANVYNELVCEVVLKFQHVGDDSEATNTLYFANINPVDAGMMEDLLAALETWVDTEWQPLASNSWRSIGATARSLASATAPVVDAIWSYTGAVVSTAPPNNATIAVSFRTGLMGRSMRGRNYFVGLSEVDISGSQMPDVVLASMVEGYEALIPLAVGLDFTWVVYSRFSGGAPRATGLATPITHVVFADTTTDSQRKRLPNH